MIQWILGDLNDLSHQKKDFILENPEKVNCFEETWGYHGEHGGY